MTTRHLLLFVILFNIVQAAFGQIYLPGQTYFGIHNYIEYQPGSLPLILTAPHGGTLLPAEIPDRKCTGCVYVMDAFTEELAREMADAIELQSGCRPHLIINRLHRRKLDANRGVIEAADGTLLAEQAWEDFHRFIKAAKDSSTLYFGRGLFIDLHGHGHSVQRLELGYLLYGSELALSDSILNTPAYINYSSIRGLALNNLNSFSHAQLLRGTHSLGTSFEDQLYRAVPSLPDPYPSAGQSYFSGGYNTERHGSSEGGPIDAIQIECNFSGVRDTPGNRTAFAQTAAAVLEAFLQQHYFGSAFPGTACQSATAVPAVNTLPLQLSPNPAQEVLHISVPDGTEARAFQLYDILGRPAYCPVSTSPGKIQIDVSSLSKGWYGIQMQLGQQFGRARFLKL